MMNTRDTNLFDKQAAICRVLGNPRRLLIVCMLAQQELSVNEIATRAGSSLQNISQHLSLLKTHGIVKTRRDRQTIYYQIANNTLSDDCIAVSQLINSFSDSYSELTKTSRRNIMTEIDLNTQKAAKVVDARAMSCPGPLLEAKKGIGTVKVGELLEIWSGDVNTKNDMPRWCEKVGHEFLGSLPGEGYERLFILRKK